MKVFCSTLYFMMFNFGNRKKRRKLALGVNVKVLVKNMQMESFDIHPMSYISLDKTNTLQSFSSCHSSYMPQVQKKQIIRHVILQTFICISKVESLPQIWVNVVLLVSFCLEKTSQSSRVLYPPFQENIHTHIVNYYFISNK